MLLAVSLLGCRAKDAASDPPQRGGAIVVAIPADVATWNPYGSASGSGEAALELLYPRLVREVWADGRLTGFEPSLASSWDLPPDRSTITFRLRSGASWSNGAPVTCEDVRFTRESKDSEALSVYAPFEEKRVRAVLCPDPHTVVFRFAPGRPGQILDVNDPIVPAAYGYVPLESWIDTEWERRMITCGPFRLASVLPGKEAVLVRDLKWWGADEVPADRVVLRVFPDASAAFDRFLDGEIDVLPGVPPLRAAEARDRSDLSLVELPSLAYTAVGWNLLEPEAYLLDRRARGCDVGRSCGEDVEDIARLLDQHPHPILSDTRVRRALSLAIDRGQMVERLWAGHALAGSSPIVSALPAHDPETALPYQSSDAVALLKSAGWRAGKDDVLERSGKPLELHVLVNEDDPVRRETLTLLASDLARIGVRIVPEALPRGELTSRARFKSFDGILGGHVASERVGVASILHARAAVQRGDNLTAWSTPASNALLDRAEKASTPEEAVPLWKEWQRIFRQEQPYAILYEERTLVGLGARVRGPKPTGLDPFAELYRIGVVRDEPKRP